MAEHLENLGNFRRLVQKHQIQSIEGSELGQRLQIENNKIVFNKREVRKLQYSKQFESNDFAAEERNH